MKLPVTLSDYGAQAFPRLAERQAWYLGEGRSRGYRSGIRLVRILVEPNKTYQLFAARFWDGLPASHEGRQLITRDRSWAPKPNFRWAQRPEAVHHVDSSGRRYEVLTRELAAYLVDRWAAKLTLALHEG